MRGLLIENVETPALDEFHMMNTRSYLLFRKCCCEQDMPVESGVSQMETLMLTCKHIVF